MATLTQMPAPPPDHGGLRPNRNEKKPTIAAEDDEDWVRELRAELQRNMEERLHEQEKEIEDEIQVLLDEGINSGKYAPEDRKDQLARMRFAMDQRLKRMEAMLMEESEAMIREERSVRQWSVDGGLPTGDSEVTEAFKREQQALLDKFSKDGRSSMSSSPVAERQRPRDPSPPPSSSTASNSHTNTRPSAPRISPSNSASSAQTSVSQSQQQQQRKASNQHIWKPPVQQNDGGYPRKASVSSNVNHGFSTPQRAGSISDNGARRNAGASSIHIPAVAYKSPYYSIQSSNIPNASYPPPFSNTRTKPQQSVWLDELAVYNFTDEPGLISGSEDDDYQGTDSESEEGSSDEEPTPALSWQGSLRGMPPKSSPRVIQGDRGRGRGRGHNVRPSIPSQQYYGGKLSSGDLRGKFDAASQPRAAPSNPSRSIDHPMINENLREDHKTSQPPQLWSPEGSKPTQARPIPSSNITRNSDHGVYADGASFGSYGSLGSVSNYGPALPPRRSSNANVTTAGMTPEEREKDELREADRRWEKMEKARASGTQISTLPPSQPSISSASRSSIPVPQSSSARQRTPEPLSSSPKPGSGSFRDKVWIPTPPPSKPSQERERNESLSTSRSPPQLQQSTYRTRNDSDASASRTSERRDPHKSGASLPQPQAQSQPQHPISFSATLPSHQPPQRPTETVKFPLAPPLTASYSSDSYESDFSSRSRPSAVPLSRQPTEELPYQPSERDRFRPRNKDDSRKDDDAPVSTESHDKVNADHVEPSSSQGPSELERRAEELRQREEELTRRQKEISEREEALARREEEERRRRDNEAKLREKEKKEEEERIREMRRLEEKKALERKREEERLRDQRRKEEDKARERQREADRKREEDRRREEDRLREERRREEEKERELQRKEEERERELQRKNEERERELQRKEEEKAREHQRKEEEKAREYQRKEEEKAREHQRKEEEKAREIQMKEEERAKELQREEERNKIEQEKKDRAQAERMQREEEARVRTEEKLWNDAKRNARQNSFAADRPMSTASFASSASNASFASRSSTTSSSSGSSYSSWSSGRSATSSATSASTAPDPSRKASTSSSSAAWSASRSSTSANSTPKASSTPRPTPASSFSPKGSASSSAYASAAGASTSYEEWERKQQERMRAQQEQFQRDQMRAEQEKLRASSAASGMDTIMVAWSSYEREWNGLKEKQDGSLTWRTFPWPLMRKPSEPEDLTANGIGALVLSVHHSNEKSNRDRLKEQLLRWHPDRFENRWLKKVSDKEQEKVRNGAGQVVRALNELMTRENNLASGGGLF